MNRYVLGVGLYSAEYVDTFKDLVHQGSTLKKHKHINPAPRNPNVEHYKDLNVNRQNDWTGQNLFHPLGNYLVIAICVCVEFKISRQRLSQQVAHLYFFLWTKRPPPHQEIWFNRCCHNHKFTKPLNLLPSTSLLVMSTIGQWLFLICWCQHTTKWP